MAYQQLSNAQLFASVANIQLDTEVSHAAKQADSLAEKTGLNAFVVRTKSLGLCVWQDFKMRVAKDEIVETVYSADDGYYVR